MFVLSAWDIIALTIALTTSTILIVTTILRNIQLQNQIDNYRRVISIQKQAVGLSYDKNYSVWVGGSEINSNYLTKDEALKLADSWKSKGYEDVAVEKVGK